MPTTGFDVWGHCLVEHLSTWGSDEDIRIRLLITLTRSAGAQCYHHHAYQMLQFSSVPLSMKLSSSGFIGPCDLLQAFEASFMLGFLSPWWCKFAWLQTSALMVLVKFLTIWISFLLAEQDRLGLFPLQIYSAILLPQKTNSPSKDRKLNSVCKTSENYFA